MNKKHEIMDVKTEIMIVDDDQAFLKMLKLRLDMEGYKCHGYLDVTSAWDNLRLYTPDLIIVDLSLPDANGIVWAGSLRKHTPDLPIIIVTALKSTIEAPDPRFDRIHSKPLDWEDFMDDIKTLTIENINSRPLLNENFISSNSKGGQDQ